MPYAMANPKARKYAKAFEFENQKYLARFFGEDKNYFKKLGKEILDAKSDESLMAKVADYIEVAHFKIYKQTSTKFDIAMMVSKKLPKIIKKFKDPITRNILNKFISRWGKEIRKKSLPEILYNTKQ